MARQTELDSEISNLVLQLFNLGRVLGVLDLSLEVHKLGPRLLLNLNCNLERRIQEVHHGHDIALVESPGGEGRGSKTDPAGIQGGLVARHGVLIAGDTH